MGQTALRDRVGPRTRKVGDWFFVASVPRHDWGWCEEIRWGLHVMAFALIVGSAIFLTTEALWQWPSGS